MTKKKKTLRAKMLASIFAMLICGCSNTLWAENYESNYTPSNATKMNQDGVEIADPNAAKPHVSYSATLDGIYQYEYLNKPNEIINATALKNMTSATWVDDFGFEPSQMYVPDGSYTYKDEKHEKTYTVNRYKVAGGIIYGINYDDSDKVLYNMNPYSGLTVKDADGNEYILPAAKPADGWSPWDQITYYNILERAATMAASESELRVIQDDKLHLDDVSSIEHKIENGKLITTVYNNAMNGTQKVAIGSAEISLNDIAKGVDTNTVTTITEGTNGSVTVNATTDNNGNKTYTISGVDTNTVTTITEGTNGSVTVNATTDNNGNKTYTISGVDTNTITTITEGTNGSVTVNATTDNNGNKTYTISGVDTNTIYTLSTKEGEKGTNYTITGTDDTTMTITDTHLVSDKNALQFNKETGDLTFTVTDTGGNEVAGKVNIAEYVGSVAQANDTDTHIKAGNYKVGEQGVADSVVIDIVDKDGKTTNTNVTITDVASASNLNKEIDRSIAADKVLTDTLNKEIDRSVAADKVLTDTLNKEIDRSVAADKVLTDNLNREIDARRANDIISGSIDSTTGMITLTKGDNSIIEIDEICDSRLHEVSYDKNTGLMMFTVKDHFENDIDKSITVADIASKYNLDKLTETVGASSTTELTTKYENTTYIKEATNMVEADKKLDEAIKNEEAARIAGDNMITNRINKLGNRVDKVGAGAAALAALHPLDFDPDDKLSFSAGVGNYGGETASALGMFYRPTEKVMFSAAGTMGNGENMVNMGVTFALDKTNNVSNSRVAMAREIQDLREQVAALTALVTQLAGRSNPALQDVVMFPDVPENHWAYDYIEGLQKRGIVEGYPDGNFVGDRSMTRYEYAAMLYRALEKGFPVDTRLLDEFEAELGRIRIDRIKGLDEDANKVERVRVNQYEDRDDYGSKLIAVNAVK